MASRTVTRQLTFGEGGARRITVNGKQTHAGRFADVGAFIVYTALRHA